MVATDSVQPILNAILEIGETFAATLRLDAVLDSVIESGMRLAGGDSGSNRPAGGKGRRQSDADLMCERRDLLPKK